MKNLNITLGDFLGKVNKSLEEKMEAFKKSDGYGNSFGDYGFYDFDELIKEVFGNDTKFKLKRNTSYRESIKINHMDLEYDGVFLEYIKVKRKRLQFTSFSSMTVSALEAENCYNKKDREEMYPTNLLNEYNDTMAIRKKHEEKNNETANNEISEFNALLEGIGIDMKAFVELKNKFDHLKSNTKKKIEKDCDIEIYVTSNFASKKRR